MAKKSKAWIPLVRKRDGTWVTVVPKERCRHERNSWIILGGHAEWCYVCGAYRRLKQTAMNQLAPCSKWNVPSGDRKINPTPKEIIK